VLQFLLSANRIIYEKGVVLTHLENAHFALCTVTSSIFSVSMLQIKYNM